MIRWIAESAKAKSWDGMLVLDFLINAVTIVVVAIPEGLPLAITLGCVAMNDGRSNLVRRLRLAKPWEARHNSTPRKRGL